MPESPLSSDRDSAVTLGDMRDAWLARGRELNEIYDTLAAVVEEPAPGMDPVADLKALGAQRDRLRAENERLKARVFDCPDAEVCKTCPCADEDDVCFPGERLRAENERLRETLKLIAEADVALFSGKPQRPSGEFCVDAAKKALAFDETLAPEEGTDA